MSTVQGAIWLMAATLALIAAALGAGAAAWAIHRLRPAASYVVWRQRG